MKHDDPTPEAVKALQKITSKYKSDLPADLEAAWTEWSGSIRKVDVRTMTLLRAAFEAGASAASFIHGRVGGLKGGHARAAKLSKKKRAEIASKAAAARWKNSHE